MAHLKNSASPRRGRAKRVKYPALVSGHEKSDLSCIISIIGSPWILQWIHFNHHYRLLMKQRVVFILILKWSNLSPASMCTRQFWGFIWGGNILVQNHYQNWGILGRFILKFNIIGQYIMVVFSYIFRRILVSLISLVKNLSEKPCLG